MYKARYKKHTLNFKRPSGTSRGVLTEKDTYYIILQDDENSATGIGECSTLKGLSADYGNGYEEKLQEVCHNINKYAANPLEELREWPSICFGVETAIKDLQGGSKQVLFPSAFTDGKEGIYINGLIWMGSFDYMREQLDDKIKQGFNCIKIKIGGIDFREEQELLALLRKNYPAVELRLDANGAFENDDKVLDKLEILSQYDIHSIEQPIMPGSWKRMAEICLHSPIPIALDEELIGEDLIHGKEMLVDQIQPQYIILKPSLLGGFAATQEWIDIATRLEISWWVTSALESNIGLNAIAQWVATLSSGDSKIPLLGGKGALPQGLGTGQLYTNNIPSPLVIEQSKLWYKNGAWDLHEILKS